MIAERTLIEVAHSQQRETRPHSAWLREAAKQFRALHERLENWEQLDENERKLIYRIAVADETLTSHRSLRSRLSAAWREVQLGVRFVVSRDEALKYLQMYFDLLSAVRARVGKERWEHALADREFVVKAEAGRSQIAAGQAIPYPKPK